MESTKNYESEINIKDMILAVMKKLGVMIIAGAVLGGAMGSFKVLKIRKLMSSMNSVSRISIRQEFMPR